jgi:hypothetical protein
MNADPNTIDKGGNSVLSWSSTNATNAYIDQLVGYVPVKGSKTVSPSKTTTYTGTFKGPGGSVTCSAKVTVNVPESKPEPKPEPEPEEKDECRGSIGNYIWNDTNGDGVQDKNEEGLDNIRVKLVKVSSNKTYRTETDSDGEYEFKDLCSGEYKVIVKEEDVAGFVQTYDPDGKKDNKTYVRLKGDKDDHTKADFGYRKGMSIPATGSGSLALLISALLSIAPIAGYLKYRNKKALLQQKKHTA